MDTKRRSWVKSITWRVFGIILLGAISLVVTRDWKAMTTITLLFHGIRLVLYYYHERIWERISWGKVKEEAPHITVEGDATVLLPIMAGSISQQLKG